MTSIAETLNDLRASLNTSFGTSPEGDPPPPQTSNPGDVSAPQPQTPYPPDVPADVPAPPQPVDQQVEQTPYPEDVPADVPAPYDPLDGVDFSGLLAAQDTAKKSATGAEAIRNKADKGEFQRGFESSIDNTTAMVGGLLANVGAAMNNPTLKNYGRVMADRNLLEAQANPGKDNIFEVETPGDFMGYLAYTAGSFTMDAATFAAGGGAAAIAGKVGAKSIAKNMAKRLGVPEKAVKDELQTLAAKVGATTMGVGMGVGETANQIYADTGEYHPTAAFVTGTLVGALDTAPFLHVASKITKDPTKLAGVKQRIMEYAKEITAQGTMEGFTEATQEALQKATVKYLQDSITDWSVEDFKELANAAAAGFFMGGGLGVASPAFHDAQRLTGKTRDTAKALVDTVVEMKTKAELIADRDAIKSRMADAKEFMKKQAKAGFVDGAERTKQWVKQAAVATGIYDKLIKEKDAVPENATAEKTADAGGKAEEAQAAKAQELQPDIKVRKLKEDIEAKAARVKEKLRALGVSEDAPRGVRRIAEALVNRDTMAREIGDRIKAAKDRIKQITIEAETAPEPVKAKLAAEMAGLHQAIQKDENAAADLEAQSLSQTEVIRRLTGTMATDEDLAKAAEDTNLEPSKAQVESGNYKKARLSTPLGPIRIENPAGSTRSSKDPENPWTQKMRDHYGYLEGTKGADGDPMDVFVGSVETDDDSPVFVINQKNADGSFDEHKAMIGYKTKAEAVLAYRRNYPKGWDGILSVATMRQREFKDWARNGDTSSPAENTFDQTWQDLKDRMAAAEGKLPKSIRLADEAMDFLDKLSGYSEIANGFLKGFESNQAVNLVGMQTKTVADIAALVQVFRNPNFETMRYVFTDQHGIVRHVQAVSSRNPASTSPFSSEFSIKDLKDLARKNNWRVTITHNHPSGRPKPSVGDIKFTAKLRREFRKAGLEHLMGEHIVTDHGRYALIKASGEVENYPQTRSLKDYGPADRRKGHDLLGKKVFGTKSFVDIATSYVNLDQTALIGVTADGRVAYLGTMDVSGPQVVDVVAAIRRVSNAARFVAVTLGDREKAAEIEASPAPVTVLDFDGTVLAKADGRPTDWGEAITEETGDTAFENLMLEETGPARVDLTGETSKTRNSAFAAEASLSLEAELNKTFWEKVDARWSGTKGYFESKFKGNKTLTEAIKSILRDANENKDQFIGGRTAAARTIYKGLLGIYNLIDMLEKDIPRLKTYRRVLERMDSVKGEILDDAISRIAPAWRAVKKADSADAARLSHVIHATTAVKYDPRTGTFMGVDIKKAKRRIKEIRRILRHGADIQTKAGFALAVSDRLKKYDNPTDFDKATVRLTLEHERDAYLANKEALLDEEGELANALSAFRKLEPIIDDIDAAWSKLSDRAREVYGMQVDFHRDVFDKVQEGRRNHIISLDIPNELRQKLLDELDDAGKRMRASAPYAPLKRFGKYWVAHSEEHPGFGEVKIMRRFENERDQLEYLQRLDSDPNAHVVRSGSDVQSMVRELDAAPQFIENYLKAMEEEIAKLDKNSPEDRIRIATIEEQKEMMLQQYLASRPDGSYVKSYLEREGNFGFEEDAAKSFADHARAGAMAASRAHFSWKLHAILREILGDVRSSGNPSSRSREEVHIEWLAWRIKQSEVEGRVLDTSLLRGSTPKLIESAYAFKAARIDQRFSEKGTRRERIERVKARVQGIQDRLDTMDRAREKIDGDDLRAYRRHVNWLGGMIEGVSSDFENRLDPSHAALPRIITQFGFLNAIALSPFAAALNTTQLYLATVPVLGGRYGNKRVAKEVAKLQSAFLKQWKQRRDKGSRTSLRDRDGLMTDLEKEAFEELIHRGRIDRGIAAEMIIDEGAYGLGNAYDRAVNWSAGMFAFTENMNREVTALVAYRLKFKELTTGDDAMGDRAAHQRAIDHASEMIILTQGEYATLNAGKWFRNDFGRIALQFKKFAVMQFYLYARTFNKAFNRVDWPEHYTGKDRRRIRKELMETGKIPDDMKKQRAALIEETESRRVFASLYVAQALIGGFGSIMGAGILLGIADSIVNGFDDEDDEIPLDVYLENRARELAPDWAVTGFTSGVFNVFGMDVSSRVNLNIKDMILRQPTFDRSAGDELQATVLSALGPVIGGYLATSLPKAADRYEKGDLLKAAESGLPNVEARNLVKALRRLMYGERSSQGALVDEVGVFGALLTALGLAPAGLSHQYEVNAARANLMKRYQDKKSMLLKMLFDAVDTNDFDYELEVRSAIEEFNKHYPAELAITDKVIKRSLAGRRKRRDSQVNGLSIPNYLKPYVLQQLSFGDE